MSENGEGEDGAEGGSIGVGVTGVSKRAGVCSDGCTNGFSDVPEVEPVPASKLVLRSNIEGVGECTATLPERSTSSRGTA